MKYNLILSIYCFVYILTLVVLPELAVNLINTAGQIFRSLLELLTIPTILAAFIFLIINGIQWKKDGFIFKSPSFYPFLLNVLTVLMMLGATIADL